MNYNENLLVVAQEECAEIQQEISKALRFGLDNYHPAVPTMSNAHRILTQYYQLQEVMEMLISGGVLPELSYTAIEAIKHDKKCNVEKYARLSQSLGRIE